MLLRRCVGTFVKCEWRKRGEAAAVEWKRELARCGELGVVKVKVADAEGPTRDEPSAAKSLFEFGDFHRKVIGPLPLLLGPLPLLLSPPFCQISPVPLLISPGPLLLPLLLSPLQTLSGFGYYAPPLVLLLWQNSFYLRALFGYRLAFRRGFLFLLAELNLHGSRG